MTTNWDQYVRPAIRAMAGYTPGEQPQTGGVLKLNTNENPYPPSPKALEAMRRVLDEHGAERLRRYPEPLGDRFRATAARVLGVRPGNIVIGNGSDDILTILTRTLVPEGGRVLSLEPSYLLYGTLASLQGARMEEISFATGWELPEPWPKPGAWPPSSQPMLPPPRWLPLQRSTAPRFAPMAASGPTTALVLKPVPGWRPC